MNKKWADVLIVGFAFFSMYFGAGNLIFPPSLGAISGTAWISGLLGFLIAEVGLTASGLIAVTKSGGSSEKFSEGLPKPLTTTLFVLIALILGPLFIVPRTAATTYEIAILPMIEGTNLNTSLINIISNFLFFVITTIFVLTPSNIIDKVGKILTPFLIAVLGILILKGVFFPLGTIVETPTTEGVFSLGMREGYQTMDALGSVLFGSMLISSMKAKGYEDSKTILRLSLFATLIACIGLALAYGGLTYLGASSTSIIPEGTGRTARLVLISKALWGDIGRVLLGLSCGLACLTTAIGLLGSILEYFETTFHLPFKPTAIVLIVISFFISIVGVDGIITFAGPILEILYPIIVVLILMAFLANVLPNFWFKRGAIIGATVVAVMTALLACDSGFGTNFQATPIKTVIDSLPLSSIGVAWFVPALVCSLVCGGIAMLLGVKDQKSELEA